MSYKRLSSISLTLFWLTLLPSAYASCECQPLAVDGVYNVTGAGSPIILTYLDGNNTTCPTRMRIDGEREGGPNIAAVLRCSPSSDNWEGKEITSYRGVPLQYYWKIKPIANSSSSNMFPGLPAVATEIVIDLDIPSMGYSIGKTDRRGIQLKGQLLGQGKAPPCLCEAVLDEYEHVVNMREAYGDPFLISNANYANSRGTSYMQNYWMDDNGSLHEFSSPGGTVTYDEQVASMVKTAAPNPPPSAKKREKKEKGKRDASNANDELQDNAFAAVNPRTCKIIPPNLNEAQSSCIPGIVLYAALEHEKTHEARCKETNDKFTEYLLEGNSINWANSLAETGLAQVYAPAPEGSIISGTVALPPNAYIAWAQSPEHQAIDEWEAYARESDILGDWLNKNCSAE